MQRQSGFTLVELIIVLVILGLISAYALPRFFDLQRFDDRGFYTEVVNATRYAQQYAVATNCDVQVRLTSNSFSLFRLDNSNCTGTSFNTAVLNPVSFNAFTNTNTNVTISPAILFTFDALGVASVASNTAITVGGRSFCINAVTGYIKENGC